MIFKKLAEALGRPSASALGPLLVVDGTNLFIRAFAANSELNRDGEHVGGMLGFLRSLAKLRRQVNPSRIVVVFDGEGGSEGRKLLFPPYKGNRNTGRLLNSRVYDSAQAEKEGREAGIARLVDYLQCLPVSLLCMDFVEADDVIAWVARWALQQKPDWSVVICSTDRDYLQLVDERITVWHPGREQRLTTADVVAEYGIHPRQFLAYRTLIGDTSDNVPGITGIGPKTARKLFPELADDQQLLRAAELAETAGRKAQEKGASTLYNRVASQISQLQLNERLMVLGEHPFQPAELEQMVAQLRRPRQLDLTRFTLLENTDELGLTDPASWAQFHFATLK